MDLCLLVLGNALKVPGKKDGMTNYLMALAYLQFAERSSKLRAEASVRVANNHLKMAAQAMPDRVEVWSNYARVLLDTGDTEQAATLQTSDATGAKRRGGMAGLWGRITRQ